jgi:hypothetical protein
MEASDEFFGKPLFFLDISVSYLYYTDMSSTKRSLQAQGHRFIQQISSLGLWIEGTFVSTSRRCGKKNCACHQGGPKHPVLYLTWKEDGKTRSLYVPKNLQEEVKAWVDNYKKLKQLIRQVTLIQRQVIALREEEQK